MVEDTLDNLRTAGRLGMKTVWVARAGRAPGYVDVKIANLIGRGHHPAEEHVRQHHHADDHDRRFVRRPNKRRIRFPAPTICAMR